tara:strand:+ start:25 stop:300 length:276 start_codon:yes stop_codon:yes gene_type:complete
MTDGMLEHLKMLVLTAIFNPAFLALLVGTYIVGRVLGYFMPWHNIVKPMVIIFVLVLGLKLLIFRPGYDLYFMFGIPFIAGLWGGSKREFS